MTSGYRENLKRTLEYYRIEIENIEIELAPYQSLIDKKNRYENLLKEIQSDLNGLEAPSLPFGDVEQPKPYREMQTLKAILSWLGKQDKTYYSPKEILAGIIDGGWHTGAKNPYSVVYSVLKREDEKKNKIINKRSKKFGFIK